jgi:cytochrome c oxidase assembly factor CtaG
VNDLLVPVLLVPLHGESGGLPEPLTPLRLLTGWTWSWAVAVGVLVPALLYVWGVWTLRRRGVRWPVGRSVAFLAGGLGTAVVATMSALGTYDTVLLSVHMVQHMVLMMITPMLLALGAPMTLALRALPARPRAALVWLLHSRLARVLTYPPLALALFIATPFALYYSSFYPLTLQSEFWHVFTHLHFVVTGAMLMWPLVGIDPVPGRVSHPLRLLMLFAMLPFHAFLGVTIMSADALIARDWYTGLGRTWGASVEDDQYLAGAILWGSGDVTALVMIAVLFVQWFRSSQREAVREDRRLDRLEAAAATAATSASAAPRTVPVSASRHGRIPGPDDPNV